MVVLRTPYNRGYGGNQKLGYTHAIKRELDYVILLHGDGQYAPEYLPQIVCALGDGAADAVIASRMINRADALRGNMPLYKWFGNQILTGIENRILGSKLSEFHSGYRAYKVSALRSVPFQLNSNEFHFDTELLIQLIRTGRRIVEIPIPTFYGNEISHVNGMKYAVNCVKAVTKARLTEVGLFYEPNFDFGVFDEAGYRVKTAENTLHHHILSQPWNAAGRLPTLERTEGFWARIPGKVAHVTAVDLERPTEAGDAESIALDLDSDFDAVLDVDGSRRGTGPRCDRASAVPGGGRPEDCRDLEARRVALRQHRECRVLRAPGEPSARPVQLREAGILDLTHSRLFTIYSFRKLLMNGGFAIKEIRGLGPPILDMVGEGGALKAAARSVGRSRPTLACACSPSTFSSLRRRRTNSTTSTSGRLPQQRPRITPWAMGRPRA